MRGITGKMWQRLKFRGWNITRDENFQGLRGNASPTCRGRKLVLSILHSKEPGTAASRQKEEEKQKEEGKGVCLDFIRRLCRFVNVKCRFVGVKFYLIKKALDAVKYIFVLLYITREITFSFNYLLLY